ncbi:hypothetical protein HBI23_204140 [Parastagonospora nodorum]|nr:hypothetical protein HBH50_124640 [Parastagonospora nodorum]KAH4085503.1 hypothetical protein HBH48_150510 [Parastagonospora nodorum]KAH4167143.1 hypothetical protein HBH43_133760 [Parastagonospora nodorum]KAH5293062.1 hypothetical protein HBI12_231680 [Parastagonospora nodorum]KAH5639113.1 hypothetical protein HBI23_204140 [Parastagonospora nodorum]
MELHQSKSSLSSSLLHITLHTSLRSQHHIKVSTTTTTTTTTTHPNHKMSITDYHPRILSLSSSTPSPSSTATHTPTTQSRRPSHESAHDAHHFVAAQDKTHKTLNGSIKKMWREIKHHAVEHHKSVNAAYHASYGGGARVMGPESMYGNAAQGRIGSIV